MGDWCADFRESVILVCLHLVQFLIVGVLGDAGTGLSIGLGLLVITCLGLLGLAVAERSAEKSSKLFELE